MLAGPTSAIGLGVFNPIVKAYVLAGTCILVACVGRGPKTPEAAFDSLAQGVANGSAETVFDALDQNTRWSWMTVQRCHREAFDAVLSNFPEGQDKEQKLRYLEAAATSETAADIFAAKLGTQAIAELKGRLPSPRPLFTVAADQATAPSVTGPPLVFARIEGRWGFAGFAAESDEQKRRAVADLEMIKTSATDYERARTLGKP